MKTRCLRAFFLTNFVVSNMIIFIFVNVFLVIRVSVEKAEMKDAVKMIEGYVTIKEIAPKWGVTRRRVQTLCSEGRIPGATRFGHEWAIPVDTERPTDGRVTTGEYRNWRKKDKEAD